MEEYIDYENRRDNVEFNKKNKKLEKMRKKLEKQQKQKKLSQEKEPKNDGNQITANEQEGTKNMVE